MSSNLSKLFSHLFLDTYKNVSPTISSKRTFLSTTILSYSPKCFTFRQCDIIRQIHCKMTYIDYQPVTEAIELFQYHPLYKWPDSAVPTGTPHPCN